MSAKSQKIIDGNIVVQGIVDALEDDGTYASVTAKTSTQANTVQKNYAKGSSDSALESISEILSDNIATPDEKVTLQERWNEIYSEYSYILTRATTVGFEDTNAFVVTYKSVYASLYGYLFVDPGVLNDLTVNTTIVGSTLRQRFTDYYDARESLLSEFQSVTPTYEQLASGIDDEDSGLTTTPDIPTLVGSCLFTTAYLYWNRQAGLTGVIKHRLYRATALDGEYSLIAELSGYSYSDSDLALGGTDEEPETKGYYYRVSRVVNDTEGSQSNTLSVTASPIPEGVLEAGSVTASKIAAGVLNALIANIASQLTISGSTGFTAGDLSEDAAVGSFGIYMDDDEIGIKEKRSTGWVFLAHIYISGESEARRASFMFGPNDESGLDYRDADGRAYTNNINKKITNYGKLELNDTWEDAITIGTAGAYRRSLIKLTDGRLIDIYSNTSGYLAYMVRALDGTWGDEVASTVLANHVKGLLLSDETILCLYESGLHIREILISADLVFDTAYTDVVSSSYSDAAFDACLKADGISVLLVYRDTDVLYARTIRYIERDSDGAWGTDTSIMTSSYYITDRPALVLRSDGSILLVFSYGSTSVNATLAWALYSSSAWSSVTTMLVFTYASAHTATSLRCYPCLSIDSSGIVHIVFRANYVSSSADYSGVEYNYFTLAGAWYGQYSSIITAVIGTNIYTHDLQYLSDGSFVCVIIVYDGTNYYIKIITRSSGTWGSAESLGSIQTYYPNIKNDKCGAIVITYIDTSGNQKALERIWTINIPGIDTSELLLSDVTLGDNGSITIPSYEDIADTSSLGSILDAFIEYDLTNLDISATEEQAKRNIIILKGTLGASRTLELYWDSTKKYGNKKYKIINKCLALSAGYEIILSCNGNTLELPVRIATLMKEYSCLDIFIDSDGGIIILNSNYEVYCQYYQNASISTLRFQFNTKVYDDFGLVTTGSSWVFTAPFSGVFDGAGEVAGSVGNEVYLGKGAIANFRHLGYATNGVRPAISFSVYLEKGETIFIYGSTTSGHTYGSTEDWITIKGRLE